MMQIISKFLVIPFYPIGLVSVSVAVSLFCLWKNYRKTALGFGLAGLVLLYLFSTKPCCHFLLRSLENNYPQLKDYPRAAAVVLAGGAGVAPTPPRQFVETNQYADRIFHAVRLWKSGFAPFLVVLGGQSKLVNPNDTPEARELASIIMEFFNGDSAHLILEEHSQSTHEHAPALLRIFQERGLPAEIILVTSALHLPRAVAVFKKAGFTVYPAPTDFRTEERLKMNFYLLFPQAEFLYYSTSVLHEYYGLLVYRLLGWI